MEQAQVARTGVSTSGNDAVVPSFPTFSFPHAAQSQAWFDGRIDNLGISSHAQTSQILSLRGG